MRNMGHTSKFRLLKPRQCPCHDLVMKTRDKHMRDLYNLLFQHSSYGYANSNCRKMSPRWIFLPAPLYFFYSILFCSIPLPWKVVVAPCQTISFRFLTSVSCSLYSPMAACIFLQTSSLMTWILYKRFNSLR